MVWQSKVDTSLIFPPLVAVLNHAFEVLGFKGYSGLRTFAEQDELYAKGRTAPGPIVTNAKGGQSMHNYGLAVDSAPLVDASKPSGNVHWPDPNSAAGKIWYELEDAVMEAATALNIDSEVEWGGRWKFRDVPHVQVRITLNELRAGHYPACRDIEWLVMAHTTFLYDTPWMNRRVQFMLNALDYKCGSVDGFIGSRTMEAVNDFQTDRGLEETYDDHDQTTVEKLVRKLQDA